MAEAVARSRPERTGWRALTRRVAPALERAEGLTAHLRAPIPDTLIGDGQVVRYGTRGLACVHEAGHLVAALGVEAKIDFAEVQLQGAVPCGRTRARAGPQARRAIALGGFAVEVCLWRLGRLRGLAPGRSLCGGRRFGRRRT